MLYVRGPRSLASGDEAPARGIVPSPARAASPCEPFRAFAPKTERLLPVQAVLGYAAWRNTVLFSQFEVLNG